MKFKGYQYSDIQLGDCIVNAKNEIEAKEKCIKILSENLKKWLRNRITIYKVEDK